MMENGCTLASESCNFTRPLSGAHPATSIHWKDAQRGLVTYEPLCFAYPSALLPIIASLRLGIPAMQEQVAAAEEEWVLCRLPFSFIEFQAGLWLLLLLPADS